MMGEVHFAELKAISCGVTAKKTEIRVSMPQAWPKTPPEISGLGARCFAAGRQTLSASISKINLKIQRATEYWTLPPGRRGRSGPVWAEPGASWEYSTIPKENGLAMWFRGSMAPRLYRTRCTWIVIILCGSEQNLTASTASMMALPTITEKQTASPGIA